MNFDDAKGYGIKYFFYHLGFIGAALAVIGVAAFIIGLIKGDVALNNKFLVLGTFLFSSAITWSSFSDLFRLREWSRIIPLAIFATLAYFSGRWLWHLLIAIS